MIAVIKRCKHCGKTYTYYASGCYCNEPTNNKEFCPECQEAINEALSKIPVKVSPSFKEISDYDDNLLNELKAIKDKQLTNVFSAMSSCGPGDNVPNGSEVYCHNGLKYALYTDEEGNLHVYKQFEYDKINNCCTDTPWQTLDSQEGFYKVWRPTFTSYDLIEVKPLEAPKAKLFYMDPIFKSKPKSLF